MTLSIEEFKALAKKEERTPEEDAKVAAHTKDFSDKIGEVCAEFGCTLVPKVTQTVEVGVE